jgi:hypothetical protein
VLEAEGGAELEGRVELDGAAELGGGVVPATYQTASQRVSYSVRRRTLISVSGDTLVGLWTVITLVQALVTTSHSNPVVVGEVPRLLGRAWI